MRSLLAAVLIAAMFGASVASAEDAARGDTLELRHSDEALRATYAKGKRMNLPRLLLLDAQGRPLLVQIGYRDRIAYMLAQAMKKDQPIQAPLTLDTVLEELVDANGQPVKADALPKADAYVVDYWAEWCAPCRMLARDIDAQMKHWAEDGKHVVWLKVESDPDKLPENKK